MMLILQKEGQSANANQLLVLECVLLLVGRRNVVMLIVIETEIQKVEYNKNRNGNKRIKESKLTGESSFILF